MKSTKSHISKSYRIAYKKAFSKSSSSKKKFLIKWMYFKEKKQFFIGIGIIIGKTMVGITIFNLFIGVSE